MEQEIVFFLLLSWGGKECSALRERVQREGHFGGFPLGTLEGSNLSRVDSGSPAPPPPRGLDLRLWGGVSLCGDLPQDL